MTSVGQAGAKRRPFPALDPEPPPRSWGRRLLIPATAVVLVAAVVVTVQFWPFSSAGPKPAAAARVSVTISDGRVGAEGHAGEDYLVVSRDGSVQLPPEALESVLPPGSLAKATLTADGVQLRRVDMERD